MPTNAELRAAWERCPTQRTTIPFLEGRITVAPRTVNAFGALSMALEHHRYRQQSTSTTGAYNCRRIRHADGSLGAWSLHAYGIAVDIEWDLNPRRALGLAMRTVLTSEQIDAALAIQTRESKPVFTWGGHWRWPDPMHFEIRLLPADLAAGIQWSTVAGTVTRTGGMFVKLPEDAIRHYATAGWFPHVITPNDVDRFVAYWSGKSHGERPQSEWDADFWPAWHKANAALPVSGPRGPAGPPGPPGAAGPPGPRGPSPSGARFTYDVP